MTIISALATSLLILSGSAAIGFSWAGLYGLSVAVGLASIFLLYHAIFFEEILLRAHGAQDVRSFKGTSVSFFGLNELVTRLAFQLNRPRPAIYFILEPSPIVFSVASTMYRHKIVLSSGLLALLDEKQLESVLIHEFARARLQGVVVTNYMAALNYSLLIAGFGKNPTGVSLRYIVGFMLVPILWFTLPLGRRGARGVVAVDRAVVTEVGDTGPYCSALRRIHGAMGPSANVPLSLRLAAGSLYIVNPLLKHPWISGLGLVGVAGELRNRISRLMIQGHHNR